MELVEKMFKCHYVGGVHGARAVLGLLDSMLQLGEPLNVSPQLAPRSHHNSHKSLHQFALKHVQSYL